MTCYATGAHDLSPQRRRLERGGVERFLDLSGLSDADAARQVPF